MSPPGLLLLFTAIITGTCAYAQCFSCAGAPAGTIWCDDFEDTLALSKKYFEYDNNNGDFIPVAGAGRNGSRGMRTIFQTGEVGAGSLKKSIGRTPSTYIGKNTAQPSEKFSEIYWRIDVRLQPGWTGGGGDKLTRATCMANSNWAQGMIAHLWSGGSSSNYLVMDPASGINTSGNLVSTTYNDFPNLRWLGAKTGNIPLFGAANAGRWFCVEGHAKLNTPGQTDGIFEFWINDTLQARSANLNWHGNWNSDTSRMTINAVFFENYWNAGSAATQERYFDNLVISSRRIGCGCLSSGIAGIQQVFEDLMLYPNPAGRLAILEFTLSRPELISCVLFDLTGKQIWSGSEQMSPGLCRFELDLAGISPGLYFLRISSAGNSFTGKLMVGN